MSFWALLGSMAILAALPSVRVMMVVSRALSLGFWQGVWCALGIVAADLVFVLLAVFGLALLVESLGGAFGLLRYLAAGYLLWLAWRMGCQASLPPASMTSAPHAAGTSFSAGFLMTLADQKAVFFYLGFLPGFLDLNTLTLRDIAWVALATLLGVGGVKILYAGLAVRVGRFNAPVAAIWLHRLAAAVMVIAAAGLVLAGEALHAS
ncbi:MAG: LysE family translocator [Gammaproteobacteria bacterium]|nr:LysE family translocator [Gammaproteobacteria bacterium]